MPDETLTNILNLLQNSGTAANSSNSSNSSTNNNNSDWQNMLIKLILSGGLNNLFAPRPITTPEPPQPEKPRTIDLANYQRID